MMELRSLFVFLASVAAVSEGTRLRRNGRTTSLISDLGDAKGTPQMEVVPATMENVGLSDMNRQSCTCSFWRQNWQQWPRSREGAGCIGGCGGSDFQIDHDGGIIKTIVVWFHRGNWNDYIRGIRVNYEDGHSEEVGGREGNPAHFTFQLGEWIVGDLRLSGNGIGTRLGSIAFDTNLGNTFDVGKRDPRRYYFATGGTASRPVHLAGLSGAAGWDIDRLGVIFWKPISDTSYLSINYPTLSELARLTTPTQVRSRVFCNDGPHGLPAQEETESESVTTGSEHCLTTSLETQFSTQATISGGVPFLKEASASAEWSLTAAVGLRNCWTETTTKETTLKFPGFTIPAFTRVRQSFSQWSGSLPSLPYTAVLRVTMTDGTIFERNVDGVYRGVRFNDAHLGYSTDLDVAPGECTNAQMHETSPPEGDKNWSA